MVSSPDLDAATITALRLEIAELEARAVARRRRVPDDLGAPSLRFDRDDSDDGTDDGEEWFSPVESRASGALDVGARQSSQAGAPGADSLSSSGNAAGSDPAKGSSLVGQSSLSGNLFPTFQSHFLTFSDI